jgi:transposase-like protein
MEAYEHFLSSWHQKYPKAVERLQTDVEELFTFYEFPASHWVHIRTTNPIESTYATVRLRTKKTKGCGSRVATLTMVFKLAESASKHWRVLNGSKLLADVIAGVQFVDGVKKQAA